MAALPYMQLYVADYLADAAHLSTLEHGAYLLLMFNYWQRGESFKAKDEQTLNKRLATVARLTIDEWENIKYSLSEFFSISETEWIHNRIERDLAEVNSKSMQASLAGKRSAEKRRAKSVEQADGNKRPTDDEQINNGRSTDVQPALNHTEAEADTDTEYISTTSTGGMFEKFPMFVGWRLSDSWRSQVVSNGLKKSELESEVLNDSIREFISHWITENKSYSQGKWEQKLAQSIVKKRRFKEASHNGTSNRNTRQSDTGIEHTATDESWKN